MLLEHNEINTHVINPKEDKQPLYKLIYSLKFGKARNPQDLYQNWSS